MFCPYCGRPIDEKADVCLGCGCSVQTIKNKSHSDSQSVGWWWLGFFFPFIGFILWCVWTGTSPQKARRVGWGAIVGAIVSVALVILIYVVYIVLFALVFSSAWHY